MPSGIPTIDPGLIVPGIVKASAKPWWKSRLLWLNVIVLAFTTAEAQLGVLQPLLPVNVYGAIAFGLPILNVVLRFATSQPLSPPAPKPLPELPAATEDFQ